MEDRMSNLSDEVDQAFMLLLDEIRGAIERTNERTQATLAAGEYDDTRALIDRAQAIDSFHASLTVMRETWRRDLAEAVEDDIEVPIEPQIDADGDVSTMLEPNVEEMWPTPGNSWTLDETYWLPILQILARSSTGRENSVSFYGSLYTKMKPYFSQIEQVDSGWRGYRDDRWRMVARLARGRMIENGLLAEPDRNDVWAISEKGRKWLASSTIEAD